MEKFTITIDGIGVEVENGMTVLDAARRSGMFIPSLCAHPALEPYGACRLCVVEIDGVRGTPTSCTTPATAGMVVRTTSAALEAQRRTTLELMMSGHPSACLVCDSRLECENTKKTPTKATAATRCGACSNRSGCNLRSLALGNFQRTIGLPTFYDANKVEKNDAFIDRDHNLCVLCGICFRVCEKVHGTPAIAIANRGKNAKIQSAFDKKWSREECRFCGACIDECPTGCLTDRWSKWFGSEGETVVGQCEICPVRCEVSMRVQEGRVVATQMVSLDKKLCVNGRFLFPRIMASPQRLLRFARRLGTELIPCTSDEALAALIEILRTGKLAILADKLSTQSNLRNILKSLAGENVRYIEKAGEVGDIMEMVSAGNIDTVLSLGNFLSPTEAAQIPHLVCLDFLQVPAVQSHSEIIIPITVLGEKAGSPVLPRGEATDCTQFLEATKTALGLPDALDSTPAPQKSKEKFIYAHSKLPRYFCGHSLVSISSDLELLGFENITECQQPAPTTSLEIIEKKLLAPNFHSIKIQAPKIAQHARAGHFAILMANRRSERSPFTICDWDSEAGWVEFVIEELGRSSAELAALTQGDKIAAVSGPLGTPFDFAKIATCSNALLLGGCYGVAAIQPLAREMKSRGLRVTVAIEASSSYLIYGKSELENIADEVVVLTRDGTAGTKGGCADVLAARGSEFDCVVAIGCVLMMKQCAAAARGVATFPNQKQFCALNPIMVDGTGMCGACRVAVDGKTKFACVDGPFFPLCDVDFDELARRRSAYSLLEVEAMPRHAGGPCAK